jgi:hypothetical protein
MPERAETVTSKQNEMIFIGALGQLRIDFLIETKGGVERRGRGVLTPSL